MDKKNGFSFVELIIAMAIGGAVSLAMASVFTFAAEQFNTLMDQNETEESLLLASYYLRAYVAQAVKITNTNGNPAAVYTGTPDNSVSPLGVSVGYVDVSKVCTDDVANQIKCKTMGAAWAPNAISTFGIFLRENGGDGVNPTSDYTPTGIFYKPPDAAQAQPNGDPGILYIGQLASPTGNFTISNAGLSIYLKFDHLVAFGLVDPAGGSASFETAPANPAVGITYTPLTTLNMYLRARYFKPNSTSKFYSSDPATAVAAGSVFRDIETSVYVNLRDNVLGPNPLGPPGVLERLTSGLYFYKFAGPQISNF